MLFTLEMLLRMITLGSVVKYLKEPWNSFDAVLVAIGYLQFIPTGSASNTSGIRALRALRALRPLRTIARLDSLKFVTTCFFQVGYQLHVAWVKVTRQVVAVVAW